MEIRSIKIDFDKDILKVNGKKVEKSVIVTLPGPDGWPIQKMFNPEVKPYRHASVDSSLFCFVFSGKL